ncbi:MAG: class I SAM-dependent methyltransferase [bacterium]
MVLKMRYEDYPFPFFGSEKKEILAESDYYFRKMGIEKGKHIVDFGCGPGVFTIPIARFIGKEGIVYAVDKNEGYLKDLEQMAKEEELENIRILKVEDEGNIPLPSASVDIFLLFDVLHHLNWGKIFPEVKRIIKREGKICVYPHHHLDREQLEEALKPYGLRLKEKLKNIIFIFLVDEKVKGS